MRTLCCVVLATTLGGCDQQPTPMLAASLASDMPVAGKYEGQSHATLTQPGQGVVRELDRTVRLCIGKKAPTAIAALNDKMRDFCPSPNFKLAGGRISGTSVCDVPDHHAHNIPISLGGTYDRQSIDLLINYSVDQMQVVGIQKYRRIGDC